MPTTRGNLFSFNRAFVWRIDPTTGVAVGQLNPASLGTNVTSHAYEIAGGITANLPAATFGTHEFRGFGQYEGQADAGLESLAPGEMVCSQVDAALAVLLAGGSLDTTTIASGPTIWSANDNNPSVYQVGLALQRNIHSTLTSSAGLISYETLIMPLVQMRMIRANFSQDAAMNTNTVTLSIKPQMGGRFPWGEAFGSAQGWYSNKTLMYSIQSDYPWGLTAYIANGSATTFTLGYKPVYSTVTNGRANAVYAINKVPTAPDSVNTGTGVVTLAAAGTSADQHVAWYQHENVATS